MRSAPRHIRHLGPLERLGGVAAHFYQREVGRRDKGYVYREDRIGAPIPVSASERDAFVAAARQALLMHAFAFILCLIAAYFLSAHIYPLPGSIMRGVLFGGMVGVAGAVLFASFDWAAHAPARALAARPPVGPPSDPDFRKRPTYATILVATVILAIVICLRSDDGIPYTAGLLTTMVIGSLFWMFRTWRADRRLTPAQHARAAAIAQSDLEQAQRAREQDSGPHGCLLLLFALVFLLVELAVMAGVVYCVTSAFLALAGSSFANPDSFAAIFGFIVGLVAAVWVATKMDTLCHRWIGVKPLEDFGSFIPP